MGKLADKVAVVTGASKGIGAAVARALAAEGAPVVVNYAASRDVADKVVEEIVAAGGRAVAIQGDVAKEADVERLLYEAARRFGPIDILVNNAGVYAFSPIESLSEDAFHRHFNINVLGVLLAVTIAEHRGSLPNFLAARCLAGGFLAFACLQSFPWHDWNLPDPRLFAMAPPDKSTLAPLRILDILALIYLLFSSSGSLRLVHSVWLRPLEACGRHSLEVFSVGCLLALFGRLEFHTAGHTLLQQAIVNLLGFGTMAFVGLWLDRDRGRPEWRALPAGRHGNASVLQVPR